MPALVDIDIVNHGTDPPAVTGQVIRPSSDVDVELTPSVGANWECVLTEEDGKYVTGGLSGIVATDYYGMTDIVATPGPSTILRFWFFSRYFNFGSHRIRGVLTTHGESYYTNWETLVNAYNWFTCDWETNPYTGAAWTLAEINDLIAGLAHLKDYGGYINTDYFFVEVIGIVLPTTATDPATDIAQELATHNGTLHDDGGLACACGFEWGGTIAYGNTTPTESKTTGQSFSQLITGLKPNTTYHFRAFATNAAGTNYGADKTFTTQEPLIISKAYALAREEL